MKTSLLLGLRLAAVLSASCLSGHLGAQSLTPRPTGLARFGANVWLTDSVTNQISLVNPYPWDSYIMPFVGTGAAGSADGLPGSFNQPGGIAANADGTAIVADTANGTIRVIGGGGVRTLAGSPTLRGNTDGAAKDATFSAPRAVAVDSSGVIYVADSLNHTIRMITPAGIVSTLAGNAGVSGFADGRGPAARFHTPSGIVVGLQGAIFVADTANNTIRRITAAGDVSTVAGVPGVVGFDDGIGSNALFDHPMGITVDSAGTLFVADTGNSTIRRIGTDGAVSTYVGVPTISGSTDGKGSGALLNHPEAVCDLGDGSLLVADTGNGCLREVFQDRTTHRLYLEEGIIALFGPSSNPPATTPTTPAPAPVAPATPSASAGSSGNGSGGLEAWFAAALAFLWAVGVGVRSRMASRIGRNTSAAPVLIFILLLAFTPARTSAESYKFTTLTGAVDCAGADDGPAAAARFKFPKNLAIDTAGNIYVADSGNHTIRKIDPSGNVTTLAGVAGEPGAADGSGDAARFCVPQGVAFDSGNLYVADSRNHTIRKIDRSGAVTTVAGLAGTAGKADGSDDAARFNTPVGIAVDSEHNLYVADAGNRRIRKISTGGAVNTIWQDDKAKALFAVTVGPGDRVYFASQSGDRVGAVELRTCNASGGSSLVVSLHGYYEPSIALAADPNGSVFVAEAGSCRIQKAVPDGTLLSVAGSPGPGSDDGSGSQARFNGPEGIALDAAGNLYVADTGNQTIRKGSVDRFESLPPAATVSGYQVVTVGHAASFAAPHDATGTLQWQMTTDGAHWTNLTDDAIYAGTRSRQLTINAADYSMNSVQYRLQVVRNDNTVDIINGYFLEVQAAMLPHPTGLARSGNYIWVSDAASNSIYVTDGYIYGASVARVAGTGNAGYGDAGDALRAEFNQPGGLATMVDGSVIVADTANGTIRVIYHDDFSVETLSGNPMAPRGNKDAQGLDARFSGPHAVATNGNQIYVADTFNHTIRQLTPFGIVSTFAGSPGVSGSADGTGADARFNNPGGIAVDQNGAIFVADTGNNTIRKIFPTGNVITFAGVPGAAGFSDGTGTNALFNRPMGLAIDDDGTIFVADTGNSAIRKITANGTVTTLAGLPTISGLQDGTGPDALFNQPEAICIKGTGTTGPWLLVADTGNAALRTVDQIGTVTTLELSNTWPAGFPKPTSLPPAPVPSTTTNTPSGTSTSTGGTSSSSASSGGGSIEGWFAIASAVLVTAGVRVRRGRPAVNI